MEERVGVDGELETYEKGCKSMTALVIESFGCRVHGGVTSRRCVALICLAGAVCFYFGDRGRLLAEDVELEDGGQVT